MNDLYHLSNCSFYDFLNEDLGEPILSDFGWELVDMMIKSFRESMPNWMKWENLHDASDLEVFIAR
jgi:hypothetical protein